MILKTVEKRFEIPAFAVAIEADRFGERDRWHADVPLEFDFEGVDVGSDGGEPV